MANRKRRKPDAEPCRVNDIIEVRLEREAGPGRFLNLRSIMDRHINRDVPIRVFIAIGRATCCGASLAADGIRMDHRAVRECRFCGCTPNIACDGGCGWITKDVCSSPSCLAKYQAERHAKGS